MNGCIRADTDPHPHVGSSLEHFGDAMRLREDLAARVQKFNLQLHEGKTHLIGFGRYASERRRRRGEGRPEVFHFLGFPHNCGTTRSGRFIVQRCTQSRRITRKLRAPRWEMRRRMHQPFRQQLAGARFCADTTPTTASPAMLGGCSSFIIR